LREHSLCDPFDAEVSDAWRDDLFETVERTPWLDWLPLTKRPKVAGDYFSTSRGRKVPANVRLGTTAENQAMADLRIPQLLSIDAPAFFVSIEPMLSAVDLSNLDYGGWQFDALRGINHHATTTTFKCVSWIIAGGESGPGSRPTHPGWFRALRDQCVAAGVPFFFKQWGDWLGGEANRDPAAGPMHSYWRCDDGSYLWPSYRRSHSFDHPDPWSGNVTAKRVGKKAAGAKLDGREWREVPV
jgi:protein gp37